MQSWSANRQDYGQPAQPGFGRKRVSVLDDDQLNNAALSAASARYYPKHEAAPEIVNDIDFVISEGSMQYAELELDPGEAVIAEPGALIWKDSAVLFDMILGDGSKPDAGIGSRLASAAANAMAGENMFLAEFKHGGAQRQGQGRGRRPDAGPYHPGQARRDGRQPDLPAPRLPRRRQGREHRHRHAAPAEKRHLRRRRLRHAAALAAPAGPSSMSAARSSSGSSKPARSSMSTAAASPRTSLRSRWTSWTRASGNRPRSA